MSDNIALDMIGAIRGDLATIKTDVTELKERVGFLEGQTASISRRVDRIGGDVGLVRRRPDLVDAT